MKIFLLCVILAPTFSPIGVIETSAPKVKSIIPTITNRAPSKKLKRMLGESGTRRKLKRRTMQMIGITATIASCIFSFIFGFQIFKQPPSFRHFSLHECASSPGGLIRVMGNSDEIPYNTKRLGASQKSKHSNLLFFNVHIHVMLTYL